MKYELAAIACVLIAKTLNESVEGLEVDHPVIPGVAILVVIFLLSSVLFVIDGML